MMGTLPGALHAVDGSVPRARENERAWIGQTPKSGKSQGLYRIQAVQTGHNPHDQLVAKRFEKVRLKWNL